MGLGEWVEDEKNSGKDRGLIGKDGGRADRMNEGNRPASLRFVS
jgi:hypothetical protein